jgi:hypothetical protein
VGLVGWVGGVPTKPPWAGLGHPMQSSLPTLTVRISHLPGQGIYQRAPDFHRPLTVSETSRPRAGLRTHRVLGSSPSAPTVVFGERGATTPGRAKTAAQPGAQARNPHRSTKGHETGPTREPGGAGRGRGEALVGTDGLERNGCLSPAPWGQCSAKPKCVRIEDRQYLLVANR